MISHHPLIAAGVAWWALLSISVKLDTSALIVGLLPTAAIIVQHFSSRRTARRIAEDARAQVSEVHTIVNSQRTEMGSEIAALKGELTQANERIATLTDRVATMIPPPPAPAT